MLRKEFLDGYDCKARLIPTAITLAPLFWTAYYFYPSVVSSPFSLAGSGVMCIALIYLASMYFRDLGVRYAGRFWRKRGGLPSTRLARMRDGFLSSGQKGRLRQAVLNKFGIKLLSLSEERIYPNLADRRIMDAFREIKEFLRRNDGRGLVEKHGAEYGFARNLCGGRSVFVIEAIAGILVCGFKGRWPHWSFMTGSEVNLLLLMLWVPFAWIALPRMLVLSANIYAERAWITFLSVMEETGKKLSSSVGGTAGESRKDHAFNWRTRAACRESSADESYG
jgi:hypothetical protein